MRLVRQSDVRGHWKRPFAAARERDPRVQRQKDPRRLERVSRAFKPSRSACNGEGAARSGKSELPASSVRS